MSEQSRAYLVAFAAAKSGHRFTPAEIQVLAKNDDELDVARGVFDAHYAGPEEIRARLGVPRPKGGR